MILAIVSIMIGLVMIGLILVYEKTRSININNPIAGEQKIEADFDAKKKSEAERISHMNQDDLLEKLNHRNRDGDA